MAPRTLFDGSARASSAIPVSRRALIAGLGTGAALLVWASAMTWIVATPDGSEAGLARQQAALSATYEARIAALRRELDKLASRELVQQDGLDQRLSQLAARQAQIEARQSALAALAQTTGIDAGVAATTGSLAPASPVAASVGARIPTPLPERETRKPVPTLDDVPLRGLEPKKDKTSFLGSEALGSEASESEAPALPVARAADLLGRVAAAEKKADTAEARQIAMLGRFAAASRGTGDRLHLVVARLGLDADRLARSEGETDVGGPLVEAQAQTLKGPFDRMLAETEIAMSGTAALQKAVNALPLAHPLSGDLDVTSPFGYRTDPFTRMAALHTGIDLRGQSGEAARATAGGRVTLAEWTGGYGNLVEIDHGNGLSTRYGHLSSIAVRPGDVVRSGDMVGRVGSTGRSTGPHLHYETRIAGEPVDPYRFLTALQSGLLAGL